MCRSKWELKQKLNARGEYEHKKHGDVSKRKHADRGHADVSERACRQRACKCEFKEHAEDEDSESRKVYNTGSMKVYNAESMQFGNRTEKI